MNSFVMGKDKMVKARHWILGFVGLSFFALSSFSFAQGEQNDAGYNAYQDAQRNSGSNPSNSVALTPVEKRLVDQAALQSLIKEYFPMSRDEIHAFKDASAEQKKNNAMPAGPAPSVETSNIIPVDFKPGHVMPVIRIAAGSVSSIVFTDKAGKIWPIVSYTIGDPEAFGVHWDQGSGVLMVQGKKLYGQTNVGIVLKGMQIPVMITVLLGQNNWDYLDYVQVQDYLPSDQGIASSPSVTQAPPYLLSVLNGVPPAGSIEFKLSDPNAKIWGYMGKYVLLTQATLLSPAWSFRADGPNGYHAYELQPAPYLLLSNQGKVEKITVTTPSDADASSAGLTSGPMAGGL